MSYLPIGTMIAIFVHLVLQCVIWTMNSKGQSCCHLMDVQSRSPDLSDMESKLNIILANDEQHG